MAQTTIRGPFIGAEVTEVAEPEHPANRALLDYHATRAGPDGIANRADVNPMDVRQFLPGVFIAEEIDNGADIRFRLVGTEIEERTGIGFSGQRLTDVFSSDVVDHLLVLYRRVLENAERVTVQGKFIGAGVEHIMFESVMAPMRGRDGKTMMVIGSTFDLKDTARFAPDTTSDR